MKANENTVLVGEKVVLVPYQRDHVPKYHEWMLDEELRQLTASEPLTLEQEYDMQEKWQLDEDKLTFIILSRVNPSHDAQSSNQTSDPEPIDDPLAIPLMPSDRRITSLPMIGDVNLFFSGTHPSLHPTALPHRELEGDEEDKEDGFGFEAEVEIMIAEPAFRRQGLAMEALRLMLGYVTGSPSGYFTTPELPTNDTGTTPPTKLTSPPASQIPATSLRFDPALIQADPELKPTPFPIPPTSLLTRIYESNTPSMMLFEKLGFRITKRVAVFGEVEMRWGR